MDLGYWIQPVQCWIINYSEFRVEGTVFEGFLSGGFGSAFIGLFPGRDRLLAGLKHAQLYAVSCLTGFVTELMKRKSC